MIYLFTNFTKLWLVNELVEAKVWNSEQNFKPFCLSLPFPFPFPFRLSPTGKKLLWLNSLSRKMEAIRKQATKLREQVAKQQQVPFSFSHSSSLHGQQNLCWVHPKSMKQNCSFFFFFFFWVLIRLYLLHSKWFTCASTKRKK